MKVLSSPQDLLTGKAICMGVLASSTTTRRSPSIHQRNWTCFSTANRADIQTLSTRLRQQVEPFLKLGPCPLCKGARLNQAALSCKIKGDTIADMAAMEVDELLEVVKGITEPVAVPLVRTLTQRLRHLVEIGLEYLSLDRATDTLSGGESQRVKIVKHLSGSLVDVMYIFDEPSVGLHPRDVHRLNELLEKLRDKGN